MKVLMKHQDWNNKLLSLFIVSLRCIAEVTGAISVPQIIYYQFLLNDCYEISAF